MDALEQLEAAQARGDEIEQSLEDAETARDAEAEHRESTEEARWREVETGARYTVKTAMSRYPQLHSKHLFSGLPCENAQPPKPCNRHRYVKSYLATDVNALAARLAEQEEVDPRWLEVEAGKRLTVKTAMQRYPQLNTQSFAGLPFEKVRQPKIGKDGGRRELKTYSISDIEKLVARQAAPEPVDSRWREVESGARYTAATAMARYPQLRERLMRGLPFEKVRRPKGSGNLGARDVRTYLAAHIDAIAEGCAGEDAAAGGGGGDAPMDDAPAEGGDGAGGDVAGAGGGDEGGDEGGDAGGEEGGGGGGGTSHV